MALGEASPLREGEREVEEDRRRERPREKEEPGEPMGAEQIMVADVDDRPLQREDQEKARGGADRLQPQHHRCQPHADHAGDEILDQESLEVAERADTRRDVLFQQLPIPHEEVAHGRARWMALDFGLEVARGGDEMAVDGAYDVERLEPDTLDAGHAHQHVLHDGEARRGLPDAIPRIARHHGHQHHGERDQEPVDGRLETVAARHSEQSSSAASPAAHQGAEARQELGLAEMAGLGQRRQ
jgi:hypothetical protein